MKILVSTTEKQGKRKSDFCFVPENEIVIFGTECDGGRIDDACGCRRSMIGIECNKATTAFKVVEMPDMDPQKLKTVLTEKLGKTWGKIMKQEDILKWASDDATRLKELADYFPVEVALEKRGNKIQER